MYQQHPTVEKMLKQQFRDFIAAIMIASLVFVFVIFSIYYPEGNLTECLKNVMYVMLWIICTGISYSITKKLRTRAAKKKEYSHQID